MISEIPISRIKVLKESFISKKKHEQRMLNKLILEDYESSNKVLINDNMEYYGGSFSIEPDNPFLLDIIIDKYDNISISDTDKCIAALSSKRGLKIQRARFRDLYIKPINKWLRNRNITNKIFAELLLKSKLNDTFDDLVEFLESTKRYTVGNIQYYNISLHQ